MKKDRSSRTFASCASVMVTPLGWRRRSISDRTRSPDVLWVDPIRLTMVASFTLKAGLQSAARQRELR